LQQPVVVGRIVFEICILDDHDFARHMRNAGPKRRALSLVERLQDDFESIGGACGRRPRCEAMQNIAAAVPPALVDGYDLFRKTDALYPGNSFFERGRLVVDGHHDGELHCSNSRFFSSRINAVRLGSLLTASLTLFWKSAAARSSGPVSTRGPSHCVS